jgi:type IV pilus assembly protein PilF
MFQIIGLLFFLVVSGCASKPERVGFDAKKASVANTELGVAYLSKGQYKVAMTKLKKAIAYDDDNANAHHYIAELYRRLEENTLADEHFNKAMELAEEDSSIKNNYGIFLCGTGSYERGLKLFNKVLADPLYSDKGQAYENMGLCTEKQGNIRNAEMYFETALKFNKRLPSALLGLAQIAFDKNKIKDASAYLSRHNKIARQTSQSLWLGLLIARKTGHKGRVGSMALKLKQYFPDSKEVKLLKKLKLR